MGTDWQPQKAPKPPRTAGEDALQVIAVVLIAGVGIAVVLAVLWALNSM